MKSFIKSSFFLILLIGILNIGLSNAYAEEAKASEATTNSSKIVLTQYSVANSATLLTSVSSYLLMTNSILLDCNARVEQINDDYTLIVTSSCRSYIVGPNGDVTRIT